jgi:serine protease Do
MLNEFSNQIADLVAAVAPGVVQVQGRRRPASGLVYGEGVVVTTARALGREDGLRVRRPDNQAVDAELAGWDPTTGLAVLRVAGLELPAVVPSTASARVGQIGVAIGRSWSNAVSASVGNIAVIGGPLPTGPRRAIDQVIRTSAAMHDGFAGGAFVDALGALAGVTTSAVIRGFGVVIPTAIAWQAAATLLEHGRLKRGYLGIAGQAATLSERQQTADGRTQALLVVGVTSGSPAAAAGVLVGDLLLALDGRSIGGPDDLLDLLAGELVGQAATLRILRGSATLDLTVTVGERAAL